MKLNSFKSLAGCGSCEIYLKNHKHLFSWIGIDENKYPPLQKGTTTLIKSNFYKYPVSHLKASPAGEVWREDYYKHFVISLPKGKAMVLRTFYYVICLFLTGSKGQSPFHVLIIILKLPQGFSCQWLIDT
jgi:hypothetical protein